MPKGHPKFHSPAWGALGTVWELWESSGTSGGALGELWAAPGYSWLLLAGPGSGSSGKALGALEKLWGALGSSGRALGELLAAPGQGCSQGLSWGMLKDLGVWV